MSYELAVSLVSVLIAAAAFVWTWRLGRITERLNQKQLEMMERDEVERNRAKISVTLAKEESSHHSEKGSGLTIMHFRLCLKNVGLATAQNIAFSFADSMNQSFLQEEGILPLPFLYRDDEVSVLFRPYGKNLKPGLRGVVEWEDPDGSKRKMNVTLTPLSV